ncbi:hypothetical protein F5Y18DRAFT_82857 [Xylariaceae sp. FL1019]|nr:hypothetical protein F5Y18DRAFT_82857 [Xylariaceae sp. FL1019]
MSASSAPRILAEARLSAAAVSFTDGPEPHLLISLRLEDSENPITINSSSLPQLFLPTNAVVIQDTITQKLIPTPTLDINMKSVPPPSLVREQASKFVTLEPGQVTQIVTASFDPLRAHRAGAYTAGIASKLAKYSGAALGMHLLTTDREYTMSVRNDLHVRYWMEGRAEDLIQAEAKWQPSNYYIKIEPAESFRFQVRE